MKSTAMSHSEITTRATSSSANPADALREALFALVGSLAQHGATPADILRLRLTSPAPQAFHLARREIDLAWRDALGGLRRPVFFHAAPGDLVLEPTCMFPCGVTPRRSGAA